MCDGVNGTLLINNIQAARVDKADIPLVVDELKRHFAGQTENLEERIRRTREHGAPWAYPDRLLLLGATAGLLAVKLGAEGLWLPRRPDARWCGDHAYERGVNLLDRIVRELSTCWIDQGLWVAQPLPKDYWMPPR